MDLSEKIKQILVQKNLTPSLFADEIGIQRSSISHILAGRNKPSLDIVQKIVKRFPELGLNWILDTENLPEITPSVSNSFPTDKPTVKAAKPTTVAPLDSVKKNIAASSPVEENLNKQVKATRTVERVMIFYSDGTFEDFKQGTIAF